MKNQATRERKQQRIEIAYMFKAELLQLKHTAYDSKERIEFIDTKIRPLLPYSVKTNSIDIFNSLFRTLNKTLKL